MNKLQFHESKVLKLTNVLKYKIPLIDKHFDFNVVIEQMQSYLRTKGVMQVGPLIQYMGTEFNANNELEVEIYIMLQCNQLIHKVELPYSMEAVIREPDALYCRYIGPESKLKFAYDKINIEVFENDIATKNYSYTIFVSHNVEDDVMIADVFVPKKEALHD